jgi:NRPS condensation-like uncharacterized protein
MNRSFSKIRHIEKSNILLEQRYNPKVPEDEMDDTSIFLYKKILKKMALLNPKKYRDNEEFVNDVVLSTLMSLHVPYDELEMKAEKLISRFGYMILDFYETEMNK